MFTALRQETTTRILKVKMYLRELDGHIPTPPNPPNDAQNAQKGLFFVFLYGVLESIVTKTVRTTIDEINSSSIHLDDVIPDLYSILLDEELESLRQVGESRKWEKRWSLCEKIIKNEPISINQDVFPTDGRNIKKKQLNSISKSFGNTNEIFTDHFMESYLAELVENRNQIAHGDRSPDTIGRLYTIDDLEKKLNAIDELINNIITSYEEYIKNLSFKKCN